jgi:hypothetical protein
VCGMNCTSSAYKPMGREHAVACRRYFVFMQSIGIPNKVQLLSFSSGASFLLLTNNSCLITLLSILLRLVTCFSLFSSVLSRSRAEQPVLQGNFLFAIV